MSTQLIKPNYLEIWVVQAVSSTSFRDRHPWRSQIRPQKCCVNNTFQDENKNLAHNWKQPNSINSNILTPILCIYFVAFVARHEKNFNTSRLVCEISSQIARVPKSHEKNYEWNKIILFDSLCYTAKKGNIKASNISLQYYRPLHLSETHAMNVIFSFHGYF